MLDYQDNSFELSMILMCEDNDKGTIGCMINKPLKYKLKDIFKEINIVYNQITHDILNEAIHIGDLISMNNIFILYHRPFHKVSIPIISELPVITSPDILEGIAQDIRFWQCLVIASWEKNESLNKIKKNSWLKNLINYNIFFAKEYQYKWEQTFNLVDLKSLAQIACDFDHA